MKNFGAMVTAVMASIAEAKMPIAAAWDDVGVQVRGRARQVSTTPPTEKAKWRAEMVSNGTFRTEYLGLMPQDEAGPVRVTRQMRRHGWVGA